MSSDLISRQAAIDALKKAYWDSNIQSAKNDPCIVDAMTDWAIRQVKALPTIEPRAKSKWWHYEDILQCCNCSAEFYDDIVEYAGDDVPKFCPNCGADMREESDD